MRIAAALTVTAITMLAAPAMAQADWVVVYKSRGKEVLLVDAASIQASGNLLRYRTRNPNFYGYKGEESDVIADCVERKRGSFSDGPNYSVYPNTQNGDEVEFACSYAETNGILPPALTQPRPGSYYALAPKSPLETPPTHLKPAAPAAPPAPRKPKVESTGSGFFVGPRTVVTNQHVTEGCTQYTVRRDTTTTTATLLASDQRMDLAALTVDGPGEAGASIRPAAILGEDVMVAGHPLAGLLSNDLVVTGGQVNSLAGLGNDPMLMQISAPVQSGNSGGPVLDRAGSVVGVVVSKVNVLRMARVTGDMAQNVNFAIKPEVLRLFLDANRIPYRSANLGPRKDGIELAERARFFTVQVACLK